MSNLRADVESRLGHRIENELWDVLQDRYLHHDPAVRAADIAADAEAVYRALLGPRPRPPAAATTVLDRLPGGAALSAVIARIKALSRIYAAEAAREDDVIRFREEALTDPGELARWVVTGRQGPFPEIRLLDADQVGQWVQARLAEEVGDDEADIAAHLHAIFLESGSGGLADLWYIADTQEEAQTVAATGVLGKLARLADTLAGRYRWRPSEAATFVLTGRTPEVQVYVGSAEIRYHEQSTTTRVTMTLDPALAPEQVMGIYLRLRNRFHDGAAPRTLSVKSYHLAEHVGPHVWTYVGRPADRSGPGRRPQPGPHGLARMIQPQPGHTWQTLRSQWNKGCQEDSHPPRWRYDDAKNFTRDAQSAVTKLLYLDWRTPQRSTD